MDGLPERCLIVALTLLGCAAALLLLPYFWPFAVAWLLSAVLEPPVSALATRLKRVRLVRWRPGRAAATILCMLLLFGVAGWALSALVTQISRQLIAFARGLPQLISELTQTALPRLRSLYAGYIGLQPDYVGRVIESLVGSLGDALLKWAGALSAAVTSGAWSTAASIPNALLSVVLTVMGTYYMTADRARIRAFFCRALPRSLMGRGRNVRRRLFGALKAQLVSQLCVSAIVTAFLTLLLSVFGVRYGLLAGLIIGLADALPVIGAGLFLIPWSALGFLTGDTPLGVLMACAYLGTVVIRQIAEPRIVGRNLGLYPLATMAAMYAGYKLMGFTGLLAGPVLLTLVKAVLDAEEELKRGDEQRPTYRRNR